VIDAAYTKVRMHTIKEDLPKVQSTLIHTTYKKGGYSQWSDSPKSTSLFFPPK